MVGVAPCERGFAHVRHHPAREVAAMNRSIRSPMRLNLALAGLLIATAARASLVGEVPPGHYAIHAGERVVVDGSLYNSGMDLLFIYGASTYLDSLSCADLW